MKLNKLLYSTIALSLLGVSSVAASKSNDSLVVQAKTSHHKKFTVEKYYKFKKAKYGYGKLGVIYKDTSFGSTFGSLNQKQFKNKDFKVLGVVKVKASNGQTEFFYKVSGHGFSGYVNAENLHTTTTATHSKKNTKKTNHGKKNQGKKNNGKKNTAAKSSSVAKSSASSNTSASSNNASSSSSYFTTVDVNNGGYQSTPYYPSSSQNNWNSSSSDSSTTGTSSVTNGSSSTSSNDGWSDASSNSTATNNSWSSSNNDSTATSNGSSSVDSNSTSTDNSGSSANSGATSTNNGGSSANGSATPTDNSGSSANGSATSTNDSGSSANSSATSTNDNGSSANSNSSTANSTSSQNSDDALIQSYQSQAQQLYQSQTQQFGDGTSAASVYTTEPAYGNGSFNAGQLNQAYIDNTTQWTNFFRGMFGLNSLSSDDQWNQNAQSAAAALNAVNSGNSNNPNGLDSASDPSYINSSDWKNMKDTYDNSIWDYNSTFPYNVVTDYLNDSDIAGSDAPDDRLSLLGNINKIGIGQAGIFNNIQVTDDNDDTETDAFPGAINFPSNGVFPYELVSNGATWSVALPNAYNGGTPTVTVHDNTANQNVNVSGTQMGGTTSNSDGSTNDGSGYFGSYVWFTPDSKAIQADHSYTVTINNLPGTNSPYTYTTKLFNLFPQSSN